MGGSALLLLAATAATLLLSGEAVQVQPRSNDFKYELHKPRSVVPGLQDDSVDNYITMVIENFAQAMKTGIPILGMPVLDPYNISVLNLPDIEEPDFSFEANASDICVKDTSSFTPTYVHVDFDNSVMYLNLNFVDIRVDGYYWCNGLMLVIFPIFGNGSFYIEMEAPESAGSGGVYITDDNYLQISELTLNITFGQLKLFFENFMGGGSFGDELNEAMQALAQTILEAIFPLLDSAILPALVDYINQALLQHPLPEILNGALPRI